MPKDTDQRPVRLQIPVHAQVAAELERYAEGFDRPVSWMARQLLTDGVENQEGLINWLTFRVVGKMAGTKREKMQCKHLPDSLEGDVVRIQLNISEELADRIEGQAKKHFRTTTNMASMLLVWTLDDEAWMINFIQSKFSAPLRAIVSPGRVPKKKTRKKVA